MEKSDGELQVIQRLNELLQHKDELLRHKEELLRHKDELLEIQRKTIEGLKSQLREEQQRQQRTPPLDTNQQNDVASLPHLIARSKAEKDLSPDPSFPDGGISSEKSSEDRFTPLSSEKSSEERKNPHSVSIGMTSFSRTNEPSPVSIHPQSLESMSLDFMVNEIKKKRRSQELQELNDELVAFALMRSFGPAAAKCLEECVRKGADVFFRGEHMNRPVLHTLIENRNIEGVKACLRSPYRIDFTTTDTYGFSPLHLVARRSCFSKAKAVEILRLIVERVETQPRFDKIDWGQETANGYDFISIAADYECLSLFWPLIRMIPYFCERKRPIPLKVRAHQLDWNELGPENCRYLDPVKGIKNPPPPPT